MLTHMTKKITSCCAILILLLFCSCHKEIQQFDQAQAPLEEGLTAKEYISLSIKYYYQFKYDESINAANKALQIKPDTDMAFNILCADYTMLRKWDKATEAGEKAFAMNMGYFQNVFGAYEGSGNYDGMKSICEKVLQNNPDNEAAKRTLKYSNEKIADQERSTAVMVMLILLLTLVFFFTYSKYKNVPRQSSLTQTVLLSAAVSCLLYFVFFALADFIPSFNLKVPLGNITLMLRVYALEHDGIEGYTLYLMFLFGMALAIGLQYAISKIISKNNYQFIFFPLLVASAVYIATIKFIPPQAMVLNKINGSFFYCSLWLPSSRERFPTLQSIIQRRLLSLWCSCSCRFALLPPHPSACPTILIFLIRHSG